MAVIDKQVNYMGLPMNIQRGNPIPLDNTSVWYSETEMKTYAKEGLTAYVGQILSLVNEDTKEVTAYIITNEAGDLQEVGSATAGDGLTIVLDETTGKLSLAGIVKDGEDKTEAGALPTYQADGSIAWIKPSTDTVEGLQTEVASLGGRLTIAEGDIDAIEAKINSMGSILNLAATVSQDEFVTNTDGAYDASKFDVGDVILISDNGKEYVCVEKTAGTKSWELLGDADGITALDGRVKTLETNDATQDSDIDALQAAVGKAQEGETAATGLYAYADSKASAAQTAAEATAKTYTDGKVKEVADAEAENAKNIATNAGNIESLTNRVVAAEGTISSHTTSIGEINTALDSKANSANVYTKTEADELLAKKADKDSFDSLKTTVESNTSSIATLNKNATVLQGEIDAVSSTANANKAAIGTTEDEASATGTLYARIKKNAADVATAQTKAEEGVSAASAAQSTADAATETANANKSAIAGLTTRVGNVETKAVANETAIAEVKTNYQTKADAATEHSKINEAIAQNTADISSVSGRVTTTEDDIKTINTALDKKAEKADVETQIATTLTSAKSYTDDKFATANADISSLQAKLQDVTSVMDFIGVSTTDPTTNGVTIDDELVTEFQKGDVVIYDVKEYVYDGSKWCEFGDTTAESDRITTVENAISNSDTGLSAINQKTIDNKDSINTLSTNFDSYKTSNDKAVSDVDAKADANAAAIEKEATDRATAISSAITQEVVDRNLAINSSAASLQSAIDSLAQKHTEELSWGSF